MNAPPEVSNRSHGAPCTQSSEGTTSAQAETIGSNARGRRCRSGRPVLLSRGLRGTRNPQSHPTPGPGNKHHLAAGRTYEVGPGHTGRNVQRLTTSRTVDIHLLCSPFFVQRLTFPDAVGRANRPWRYRERRKRTGNERLPAEHFPFLVLEWSAAKKKRLAPVGNRAGADTRARISLP